MTEKIVVTDLYKIFGPHPEKGLELLRQGWDKDKIFAETGLTVGVQNARFTVQQGEIFVVMGLSGSGKSTLVRMLNRLIEPTVGEILVDGRDISQMSEKDLIELRRRDMSMVFQSFALMPHLTVIDNVAFGLDIAGYKREERRERALQALEKVGLKAYANSYPQDLSGGMQQRVGLARGLAVDPSILLMDEAFSALDPLIREEMQDELLRIQEEDRRTVVFISHDLDEAIRIGDRIAIMEGGRIIQIGTPEEILQHPNNDYVSAFFRGVDPSKVLTVGDIAEPAPTIVDRCLHKDMDITESFKDEDHEFAYLHDGERHFKGVVSMNLLKKVLNKGAPIKGALLPEINPIPPDAPLEEILKAVAESPCPLPVVDEQGLFKGVLSKTAYLKALYQAK